MAATRAEELVELLAGMDADAVADIHRAIREALSRACDLQQPATIRLTIALRPSGRSKAGTDRLRLVFDLDSKLPKPRRAEQEYFVTRDGWLSLDDPYDARLPLSYQQPSEE